MSATATEAPAQEHIEITHRRGHGVVAMSAVAMVAGLAVRYFGSMIGDETGAMVGIFVASIGLIFVFPALQTYLLASRYV
ncbi:MAG TPA: hypothetical protein VIT65_04825 [Microlunatus sp.]